VMRAETRMVTTWQVALLAAYTDALEQSMPQLPLACVEPSFDSSPSVAGAGANGQSDGNGNSSRDRRIATPSSSLLTCVLREKAAPMIVLYSRMRRVILAPNVNPIAF
jgi:hypothetical protein